MKPLALAFFLASISSTGFASCKEPESLFESKECLWLELQKIDREVNQAYLAARKAIANNSENENTKAALHALADAQKAWARFREKDCSVDYVMNGASGSASQNQVVCGIEHAKTRVARLREFAN